MQLYGAFLEFEDGTSGLLHVSQISHDRVANVGDVLSIGDKIKVQHFGCELRVSDSFLERFATQGKQFPCLDRLCKNSGMSLMLDLVSFTCLMRPGPCWYAYLQSCVRSQPSHRASRNQ